MSNVKHHPSADMLLSYSAGTATATHALCIATHLEHCSSCRAAHQRNNAIGGRFVEELDSAGENTNRVSAEVKNSLFAKLEGRKPAHQQAISANSAPEKTPAAKAIPRVLSKLIPKGFSSLKWQIISTSARSTVLFKDESGVNVSLLKLLPGGQVARHGHLGDEYTIVLTGSFSDESGVYQPGDFLCRSKDDCHTPVATKDAECICLVVQEAPLQFTNGIFRLLNPWLRRQHA